MNTIIEEMLRETTEKATEKATEKTRIEDIKTVMEELKYTAQQAMNLIGVPDSEQPKYLVKL